LEYAIQIGTVRACEVYRLLNASETIDIVPRPTEDGLAWNSNNCEVDCCVTLNVHREVADGSTTKILPVEGVSLQRQIKVKTPTSERFSETIM
jgi:hypothetical protein